jgi:hypothetical protein
MKTKLIILTAHKVIKFKRLDPFKGLNDLLKWDYDKDEN